MLASGVFARSLRSLFRHAAIETLTGRMVDPARAPLGRWSKGDSIDFAEGAWQRWKQLGEQLPMDAGPSWGSRLNATLAVATLAAYHELLATGVPRAHAMDLVGDLGWRQYVTLSLPALWIGRCLGRTDDTRFAIALRILLRFPFGEAGKPGYCRTVYRQGGVLKTDWTSCPPLRVIQTYLAQHEDRGELELFRRTWCSYDWAFARHLAGSRARTGFYKRPRTLSLGDEVCEMHWYTDGSGPRER